MARVFVSSTIRDLRLHREAVYIALRRLGHQSVGMEEWAASEQRPLERSLEAVRQSDVMILMVAWRYGVVLPGQVCSLTELELHAAHDQAIPCLIFMVPESAPWPRTEFDDDLTFIRQFRQKLLEQYTVGFFTAPDQLAIQVATALHEWIASGASAPSPARGEVLLTQSAPAAEVFLSYAHEDTLVAKALSDRIVQEKLSVFWDRDIPVGLTWDEIVESALDAAKCVVVLWSPAARQSEWVRIEAGEAAERGILAPALIAETTIPLRFRRIQAANLVGWTQSSPDTPGVRALIAAISRCVHLEGKPSSEVHSVSQGARHSVMNADAHDSRPFRRPTDRKALSRPVGAVWWSLRPRAAIGLTVAGTIAWYGVSSYQRHQAGPKPTTTSVRTVPGAWCASGSTVYVPDANIAVKLDSEQNLFGAKAKIWVSYPSDSNVVFDQEAFMSGKGVQREFYLPIGVEEVIEIGSLGKYLFYVSDAKFSAERNHLSGVNIRAFWTSKPTRNYSKPTRN
jgi:hypothetical protein